MGDACGLQILIRDLICSMGVWWEGGRVGGRRGVHITTAD